MKQKVKGQPLAICKPHIIWRIYVLLTELVLFGVVCYFINPPHVPVSTLASDRLFLIWLLFMCGIVMVSFIYNYPPIITFYDEGMTIQWWTTKQFVG